MLITYGYPIDQKWDVSQLEDMTEVFEDMETFNKHTLDLGMCPIGQIGQPCFGLHRLFQTKTFSFPLHTNIKGEKKMGGKKAGQGKRSTTTTSTSQNFS
jgi:hypothetical protein